MRERKSDEKSEQLRSEGNQHYCLRLFFDALLKYNESLCYAQPESENAGLAYANRSAVYFEMKLYDNCVSNIELAKRNRYPESNYEVLNKRSEKCKEMLKSQKEKSSKESKTFKLSYSANEKLPFVVECLEMATSEKYGRHIITNRALKVGDVVAIEKPFCSVLLAESKFHEAPESNIYQRCYNCLKENALDLFPCPSCCKGRTNFRNPNFP